MKNGINIWGVGCILAVIGAGGPVNKLEAKLAAEVIAAAERERDTAKLDAEKIRGAAKDAVAREKELAEQFALREAELQQQMREKQQAIRRLEQ
eukprot:6875113-Pyramimonas_sp.AAC.1